MHHFMTIALSLVFLVGSLALFATPAMAQQWGDDSVSVEVEDQPTEPGPEDAETTPADDEESTEEEDDERVQERERAVQRQREVSGALQRQLDTSARQIHIYQLAEEMIDEVVADVTGLNARAIAPAALRQMTLSPNLSESFGEFVESTLITALASHTDVHVKRCVACNSMRSRVDGDDWVVTRGLVHHDELREEAERIGAKTFLDARFAYFPGANIVAMQVEFFRAEDGAILWSETYRSDSTTAAILRSGDRVMSRGERVAELERKIDERPYYGHQLTAGFGYIPYDAPRGGFGGAMIGYRLYEQFGPDRRYLFAIGAEGFANLGDDGILGSFMYGLFQFELFSPNLNRPVIRTGPAIGGFFVGNEGNSFVGEWTLDALLQFRLGAGLSIFYFLPTEFDGHDLGGFGMKARATFNW